MRAPTLVFWSWLWLQQRIVNTVWRKRLGRITPVRMRMSRSQEGAITMGTRDRGMGGMVGKGLLSPQVCRRRAGAPAVEGQRRLGTTPEMGGRVRVKMLVVMVVVVMVVIMMMVMMVMVVMMTCIVAQVSDGPVRCIVKTLRIYKLNFFFSSTISRYSAPANIIFPARHHDPEWTR